VVAPPKQRSKRQGDVEEYLTVSVRSDTDHYT